MNECMLLGQRAVQHVTAAVRDGSEGTCAAVARLRLV